jgi:hypothetical protein
MILYSGLREAPTAVRAPAFVVRHGIGQLRRCLLAVLLQMLQDALSALLERQAHQPVDAHPMLPALLLRRRAVSMTPNWKHTSLTSRTGSATCGS